MVLLGFSPKWTLLFLLIFGLIFLKIPGFSFLKNFPFFLFIKGLPLFSSSFSLSSLNINLLVSLLSNSSSFSFLAELFLERILSLFTSSKADFLSGSSIYWTTLFVTRLSSTFLDSNELFFLSFAIRLVCGK